MVMLDIPVTAPPLSLGLTMGGNMVSEHYISFSVGIWIARCNMCKNDFTVVELRQLYFSICLYIVMPLLQNLTFSEGSFLFRLFFLLK